MLITNRNRFIKSLFWGSTALYIGFDACKASPNSGSNGFGTGDIGLLNFLYVVEQVQSKFYLQWLSKLQPNTNVSFQSFLTDISLHQLAHCEFYNSALGTNALPLIEVDFSTIDFTSNSMVLVIAEKLQNAELGAYLGIARYFQSSAFLTISQKIASVEARHASYITGLNNPSSFIDPSLVNNSGIENFQTISQTLSVFGFYIKSSLDTNNLPLG